MDERPETEADDLTPEEQVIEDDTGTSGEEAHRIGEFDDLRDRLERIESALGNITSTLEAMRTTAAAIDIDNGADVADADGDGDADVIAEDDVIEIPDYDDMDLDL
nr:MAG TPA: ferredoxin I [Bacteriophage sp.]